MRDGNPVRLVWTEESPQAMVHGTEITLVFQAKECPETLNKVTSQIMAAYAERKEKYGKTSKSGRK